MRDALAPHLSPSVLQKLTLQDFVIIKRLQHAYYDIKRAEPNFVFRTPVFLASGLEAKTPSVVREMTGAADPH